MILKPTGSPIELERLTRLRRLVHLNAPDVIIIRECLLVTLATFGNNYWRASWRMLREAAQRAWNYRVHGPFRRLLHRFGVHWLDEDGLCYICDNDDMDDREGGAS